MAPRRAKKMKWKESVRKLSANPNRKDNFKILNVYVLYKPLKMSVNLEFKHLVNKSSKKNKGMPKQCMHLM